MPGTLNYIEGSANLDGQTLGQRAIGSATLAPGQVLSTTTGRAEVLLTPGVFLRLGHNTAVRMVSPDITNTVVAVEHGRATVEVDQLFKANDINVLEDHVPVQLVQTGLYEFNADRGTVLVFEGKAAIDKGHGHWATIKPKHEVNVTAGAAGVNPTRFNLERQEDTALLRWSSLRSDYLSEANQQMAREYAAGYAPGWYWDPYMYDYTFLGAYPFYSPFGFGYYPFGWGGGFYGGYPGFYGGGYGGGYYGGGHAPGPHGPVHLRNGGFGGQAAAPHSGFRGGAFRSGGEMGGFHGGGGFGGGGVHMGGGGFGGGHGR
ncbi:MAG TPA: hypothetical protein VHU89_13790 [Acidobacteriaceae bacterium]|nr:hypothetical protein [Acidobacteriaceae bacterium]